MFLIPWSCYQLLRRTRRHRPFDAAAGGRFSLYPPEKISAAFVCRHLQGAAVSSRRSVLSGGGGGREEEPGGSMLSWAHMAPPWFSLEHLFALLGAFFTLPLAEDETRQLLSRLIHVASLRPLIFICSHRPSLRGTHVFPLF